MKSTKEIQQLLHNNLQVLSEKYFIKEIGIFGSYARQEQTEKSDIDIVVSFSKPVGLFHFMDLEEYLQELLGEKIDLVSQKAIKPTIKPYVVKDLIFV